MSEFSCEVVRVKIEPHSNADALEIARVGDYQSIVKKGQISNGSLAVYIPEQAIVPEWLLRDMNMWDDTKKKGGLAGAAGNRVKAIKLRGVLSQGLILSGICNEYGLVLTAPDKEDENTPWPFSSFAEGEDAAEFLGITKYQPSLPSYMASRVVAGDHLESTHKYDFDNLKKTPDMFEDGEEVVITEKIHGTLMMVGVVPLKKANESYYKDRVIISSKGMGAKGFVLDTEDEGSVYAQAAKKHNLLQKVLIGLGYMASLYSRPVFLIGEVFGITNNGKGIQDLTYTDEPLDYRAFDICVGNRGSEEYLPWNEFSSICRSLEIKMVPMLFKGPYSKEVVLKHTDGKTTLGSGKHIREGVVVKSATEDRNKHFGRKIAKSVSEAYLLRKNSTEFQ